MKKNKLKKFRENFKIVFEDFGKFSKNFGEMLLDIWMNFAAECENFYFNNTYLPTFFVKCREKF